MESFRGESSSRSRVPEYGSGFGNYMFEEEEASFFGPQDQRLMHAAKRRASKLRAPHMQALIRFVRATPHLWDHVLGFVQRREMMLSGTTADTENHRQFTPLLAAIATHPEARAYLQIELDDAATRESDILKRRAAGGNFYTPALVIGAGLHGSIFNAEWLAQNPDTEIVTVDQQKKLGGNFRKPGGPAYGTNSRNRREDRDLPAIPGTPGNINTMTEHAPLQVSDMTADVYADNEMYGLAIALNQYLSGSTMLGVKVVKVAKNKKRRERGLYNVTMRDVETGKTIKIRTDAVIGTIGVGVPKYGLDTRDAETRKLVDRESQSAENGRTPTILTQEVFLDIVGDRNNRFPLEAFNGQRVGVVGDKDSALTVIEHLVGLGPEYRSSVAQMGRPSKILWYGPEFETQDDFRNCTRLRYARLGSFLPRFYRDPAALVEPRDAKVVRLREQNGSLIVFSREKDSVYEYEPDEVDIVILTTGFENQKAQIFDQLCDGEALEDLLSEVIGTDIRNNISRIILGKSMDGEAIYIAGPASEIEVTAEERRSIPAIRDIPDNSVALWRYGGRTSGLAALLSSRFSPGQKSEYRVPSVEPLPLASQNFEFTLSNREAKGMFPPEINYSNLLGIRLLAENRAKDNEIVFAITETEADDSFRTYSALIVEGASHSDWINKIMADKTNQRLIAKLVRGPAGAVVIRIPAGEHLRGDEIRIETGQKALREAIGV